MHSHFYQKESIKLTSFEESEISSKKVTEKPTKITIKRMINGEPLIFEVRDSVQHFRHIEWYIVMQEIFGRSIRST